MSHDRGTRKHSSFCFGEQSLAAPWTGLEDHPKEWLWNRLSRCLQLALALLRELQPSKVQRKGYGDQASCAALLPSIPSRLGPIQPVLSCSRGSVSRMPPVRVAKSEWHFSSDMLALSHTLAAQIRIVWLAVLCPFIGYYNVFKSCSGEGKNFVAVVAGLVTSNCMLFLLEVATILVSLRGRAPNVLVVVWYMDATLLVRFYWPAGSAVLLKSHKHSWMGLIGN